MSGAGRKIKIAVVANCQGRPVADFLAILSSRIEIATITTTHLARDADSAKILKLYESSDFIFAQVVQNNYPTEFVRTARLQEEFGTKVVTWPNIFYRGQGPEIRYITSPMGRVVGPLGEYQNLLVYEAWRDGLAVSATASRMLTGGEWVDRLAGEVQSSLQELRTRETHLDIEISGLIAANWRKQRLFYTFNHPVNMLMTRVACDLLRHIGLTPNPDAVPSGYREALGRFLPAMLPPLAERLGLRYDGSIETRGASITIAQKVNFHHEKVVNYSIIDFVEESFRCFDAQLSPQTTVRVS